jgi:hypothetical protein
MRTAATSVIILVSLVGAAEGRGLTGTGIYSDPGCGGTGAFWLTARCIYALGLRPVPARIAIQSKLLHA